MRFIFFVLSGVLFLSCTSHNNSALQEISGKWTYIDNLLLQEEASILEKSSIPLESLLLSESSDFIQMLLYFQKSDIYRTYRAIPFSPDDKRSLLIYSVKDFHEVEIVLDLALNFRDSIALGNMEKARDVSTEINKGLINLLLIDGEAQRYINTSYLNLLIALVFFIIIIMLFILFLHKSLTTSLKRETEGIVFSHAYMLAQDEERARISRELHDTVIQDMRCVLLEPEKAELKMTELMKKTRDICNDLIPPDFRFSELPDALRKLCHDFGERTGIDCRAEIDESLNLEFLSMEKRLQVFRIVQEALTNIEKHAEAKEAIVTIRQSSDIIYIGISDDGKGFISPLDSFGHIKSNYNKLHIGIISMRERAAILGGLLKIASEEGEGALVCLEIPVVS
ncbi:MAG: histidine kinase [Treponema sp.]|nr:histidine kinase [Treponema sp.]MCL2237659.1 histidine kinase [Treponema sp.]